MKKRAFYIGLFLLFFLLVCAVYTLRPQRQERAVLRPEAISSASEDIDFTDMLEEESSVSSQPVPKRVSAMSARERRTVNSTVPVMQVASYAPASAVSRPRLSASTPAVQSVNYGFPRSTSAQSQVSSSAHAVSSGASSGLGTSIYAPFAQRSGASAGTGNNTAHPEHDTFLGGTGFRDGLTGREARALNEKLQLMSAGVDRAIAQALMPKSRREQLIEKYAKQDASAGAAAGAPASAGAGGNSASAQAADPMRSVMAKIASQANSIIASMRSAYGDKAAAGAEQIMKNFQREMAAVLNGPWDPQEKQIRASALNHKYNAKLAKLNQREGMKKMEASLREQNEKQLQKMASTLSPEAVSALRQKYEEYLPKRMALYQAGLSEEEFTRQEIALNEQMEQDIQQLLAQYQPQDPEALNNVIKARNEAIEEEMRRREQLPENERPPEPAMRWSEETLNSKREAMEKENKKIVQSFAAYGPEVQAQAQRILDETMEKRLAIAREGGTLREFNELVKEANLRLENLQNQARADLQQQAQSAKQQPEQ